MQYALSPASQPHPQLGLFQSLPSTPLTAAPLAHLTELNLSVSNSLSLHLLAPMLRELSEDNDGRWLTLIAPPKALNRQWLCQSGLNRERILLLTPKPNQSAVALAEQALHLGRSHTVVSFLPLCASSRQMLDNAAQCGQSQALNISLQ
ncbi:SulA-like leucine-rich domain-containing protein [Atopomonas sediminilitoris]|uniref:SulA-like leucine-rich domain-containing protein n=1 Tax=Atopomonas sediminilitoris TaxID=2919919 RepID=UPI002342DAD4|nr:SulA-like leucine-rich domain-containing protein [Atopomonas sediminilitoris]